MKRRYPEPASHARGFNEGATWFLPKLSRLADLLWPAHCLLCETQLAHHSGLCAPCWGEIGWCHGAVCYCCGAPVAPGPCGELPEERWCSGCAERPPLWRSAAAVMRYEGPGKRFVLALKTSPRAELVSAAGFWMAEAGRRFLAPDRLIIPVPLHHSRLRSRGFNQSVLLARALTQNAPGDLHVGILRRNRAIPKLAHIERASDRESAISGSIDCIKGAEKVLLDRDVILVDDVLTSGSTLNLCAEVLRSHGARHVDVLVLARNCREQERREFFQIGQC